LNDEFPDVVAAYDVLSDVCRRAGPLDEAAVPGSTGGAEVRLIERDRDRAVRRAVASLPSRYKDAVVLFYFHERDVAATAGSLGLAVGTVKARLSRAREMLKGKLGRLYGPAAAPEAP